MEYFYVIYVSLYQMVLLSSFLLALCCCSSVVNGKKKRRYMILSIPGRRYSRKLNISYKIIIILSIIRRYVILEGEVSIYYQLMVGYQNINNFMHIIHVV
eukprot:GHVR01081451.1.p1 GENE.GHVR01081451.1~~GHVR01081451.1.p1  ORF type:complete len:100 (-),score=2.07 GHVR01081451.1:542-841(-)